MEQQIEILLVEDDPNLGFVIKDNLEIKGYKVALAIDGEQGWELFQQGQFHICLLDVMVPKLDGFSLIQKIRTRDSYVPVFFLTAKSMLEDKLTGLKYGADDYIVKPFTMEELLLRIGNYLRRTLPTASITTNGQIYYIGGCVFKPKSLWLQTSEGELQLTQRETDLLAYFCSHANQVVKREDILKAIWGSNDYFMGRSLDVFITRLRKYLSSETKVKIVNLHSVGFRFDGPVERS